MTDSMLKLTNDKSSEVEEAKHAQISGKNCSSPSNSKSRTNNQCTLLSANFLCQNSCEQKCATLIHLGLNTRMKLHFVPIGTAPHHAPMARNEATHVPETKTNANVESKQVFPFLN